MNEKLTNRLSKHSKRMPERLSLLLFMLLCACTAYWVITLVKPPTRVVAAPPQPDRPPIDVTMAAGLFGGRETVTVASNYQLLGVVAAKKSEESVAILSVDGKPAKAVRQGRELLPGTRIQEVHSSYVLLSEAGILKRVMLPEEVQPKSGPLGSSPPLTPPQTAQ